MYGAPAATLCCKVYCYGFICLLYLQDIPQLGGKKHGMAALMLVAIMGKHFQYSINVVYTGGQGARRHSSDTLA